MCLTFVNINSRKDYVAGFCRTEKICIVSKIAIFLYLTHICVVIISITGTLFDSLLYNINIICCWKLYLLKGDSKNRKTITIAVISYSTVYFKRILIIIATQINKKQQTRPFFYFCDSLAFVSGWFVILLMSILFCFFWTWLWNIQWRWSIYVCLLFVIID